MEQKTTRGRVLARTIAGTVASVVLLAALLGVYLFYSSRGNTNSSGSNGAASGGTAPLAGAQAVQQASACTGYKTYGVPDVPPLDPGKTYTAVFDTNKGTFTAKLFAKDAPVTVQSFIFLARHHYFDGVTFHRVVPGFVIQGGDPTGTGQCGPGYAFKDENQGKTYPRGALAMANAGPNTNGSQFFVVLANGTSLNQQPTYNLFGQVTSGMDVVDRIASVPLGPGSDGSNSRPLQKVYMKTVSINVS